MNAAVSGLTSVLIRYVDGILRSTPISVDQVTIEPNGKWTQTTGNTPPPPRSSNRRLSSGGEEDLVEIRDISRLASVKSEIAREPGLMRTPPISSREQSISSTRTPAPTSGTKRTAGQVVDLTLSSDEDEEPPRAAKLHKSTNNLPKLSSMEKMPLRPNGALRLNSANPFNTPNYAPKDYNQPPRV